MPEQDQFYYTGDGFKTKNEIAQDQVNRLRNYINQRYNQRQIETVLPTAEKLREDNLNFTIPTEIGDSTYYIDPSIATVTSINSDFKDAPYFPELTIDELNEWDPFGYKRRAIYEYPKSTYYRELFDKKYNDYNDSLTSWENAYNNALAKASSEYSKNYNTNGFKKPNTGSRFKNFMINMGQSFHDSKGGGAVSDMSSAARNISSLTNLENKFIQEDPSAAKWASILERDMSDRAGINAASDFGKSAAIGSAIGLGLAATPFLFKGYGALNSMLGKPFAKHMIKKGLPGLGKGLARWGLVDVPLDVYGAGQAIYNYATKPESRSGWDLALNVGLPLGFAAKTPISKGVKGITNFLKTPIKKVGTPTLSGVPTVSIIK